MSPVPFDAARARMFQATLLLWAERGIDGINGGFYQELDVRDHPTDCDCKRVPVICRQI